MDALPRAARLAALVLWALPLGAQTRTSPDITPQDLRQRLLLIADDSMGGRRSGSAGDFQTAAYVASEFQRLGLRPAGDGGTWFQTVPFFFAEPAASSLSVGDAPLTAGTDYVLVGRPIAPSPLSGVPVVYGGTATDSSGWIGADQASGRLVVFDVRAGGDGQRRLAPLRGLATNPRFTHAAVQRSMASRSVGGSPSAPRILDAFATRAVPLSVPVKVAGLPSRGSEALSRPNRRL